MCKNKPLLHCLKATSRKWTNFKTVRNNKTLKCLSLRKEKWDKKQTKLMLCCYTPENGFHSHPSWPPFFLKFILFSGTFLSYFVKSRFLSTWCMIKPSSLRRDLANGFVEWHHYIHEASRKIQNTVRLHHHRRSRQKLPYKKKCVSHL